MSEHVRLRLPPEKEWLGREVILDLERCYQFMNGSTAESLPRMLLVILDWDTARSDCSYGKHSLSVGMNRPEAASDVRGFLIHNAARQMAYLGLLRLSQGAEPDDGRFLFEGMAEILAHEYQHSSRSLNGAWVVAHLLDKMHMLGLSNQRSWSAFAGARHTIQTAAPGITFILTCREFASRDRLFKLFRSLRGENLIGSLSSAFETAPAELEQAWLTKVREFNDTDDLIVAPEDVPELLESVLVRQPGQSSAELQIRLLFRDAADNLTADGVFLSDERTGRVFHAQANTRVDAGFSALIPIEDDCPPGQYNLRVTAVDDAWNVRHWNATYEVTENQNRPAH